MASDREYARDIGVSLPCDLPAGCGIAYAWCHEAGTLDAFTWAEGADLEREIATALMDSFDIDGPPVTRAALVRLAAYLRANAPERDSGYDHALDMAIMEARGK